ncbi:MAG: hypothetical protein K1X79_14340 [Oligoflexia bacterium]|nr:hypothetical protein [Oligoflexia bacterium]
MNYRNVCAGLLVGILQYQPFLYTIAQAQVSALPPIDSVCFEPLHGISSLIGTWGNSGEVFANARGQASIPPNSFDPGNGATIPIPYPAGVHPAGYGLWIEGINERGNVAVTISATSATAPDLVAVYKSGLNLTKLAMPQAGSLPAGFIKHYAMGISDQDDLLVRSSDVNFNSDIYWLGDTNNVAHLITAPAGCTLAGVVGINGKGVVAGSCTAAGGARRGFIWSVAAGPQALPGMGLPGEYFQPRTIDKNNVVYGELEYLDPVVAPNYLKITVKSSISAGMSELANSRVPAVFQPWDEGFVVRKVSPDGTRIIGNRPALHVGSRDVLYLVNGASGSLHDVRDIAPRLISTSGANTIFHPTSITNTGMGGVFADWNLGLFQAARLNSICQ